MSSPSSNIRVFIKWTEQTVFAGEDIECQITFKNVAPHPTSKPLQLGSSNGSSQMAERQRKPAATLSNNTTTANTRPGPPSRGHRTALSLNVPGRTGRSQPAPSAWNGEPSTSTKQASIHKRSISVISIGASEGVADLTSPSGASERQRRTSRGHGRSASLQIVPRRHGVNGGPISAPIGQRSSTQPSPLLISSFSSIGKDSGLPSGRQAGVVTAPNTPALDGNLFKQRKDTTSFPQNFRFPSAMSPSADSRPVALFNIDNGRGDTHESSQTLSSHSKDTVPTIAKHVAPPARIILPSSNSGTPRSSGEFYSLSNNSTETLASEYLPQQPGRIQSYTSHARRPTKVTSINHQRPPETLMMGYAQIHGDFTLDGSLINLGPFEEVKRKGAVGGQGGGVIGVETSKRDSGLLGSFGWGNIGGSIGGLLGGNELSSIKEMRGIASSKSIPLLSTPQSILFVDLRLAAGESKTFRYSFKLPSGLPPTHRGRAIKISYKLVIGTQRPGGAKEQQVTSVETPFRILGSVNSHGEVLGHDLMSPYIILRDQARVQVVENNSSLSLNTIKINEERDFKRRESTLDDFMSYVDELLAKQENDPNMSLLSPTALPRSRRQSSYEEPSSAKGAIDKAILRSNLATESLRSANRFEIARGGKRIAVIMLARPAYRLGETITAAIDFRDSEIPCYAIHASLETSERVDSSIALRSEASILRVTRKVYVGHSESTLFARRVLFSPTIPVSATPEFFTSGVSLDWRLRIEFVTPQLANEDNDGEYAELLEEVSQDDRGTVLVAAEALECESFEISVPLRVYGALPGGSEPDEAFVDGLVV